MPKQGVASSFDFGKSYGIVLGVLAGARVHVEHVSPQRWKRAMRLPADKEACRLRAIDRWPGQSHLFKLKKHADRAEAALIALWWIESRS
jgi:crossover junction endodeoxyribonuclease RuvC